MKTQIGFGAMLLALGMSGCGSSSGGSSASSTGVGSSTGSAAGATTGSSTGGISAGNVASSTGNPTTGGVATTTGGTTGGTTTGAAAPSWTVTTFVGATPTNGSCGAFGPDTGFAPQFLGVDSNANIYVTVADNNIDKITPSKTLSVLTTLTGNSPNGFCVNPSGAAYYSQTTSFGEHTQIDQVPATSVFDAKPSCTDGAVTAGGMVGFGSAAGIAIDSSGNFYVADAACYKVRELSANGSTISTVAGTGTQGIKNGAGDVAQFSQLSGITIDSNGNLYVSESDIGDIRQVQSDGTTSTVTTSANSLGGMAVGPDGTLYFSDFQLNHIKQVTPGGSATVIAGTGVAGYADGPGLQAKFNSPAGVGVDSTGNVYVADTSNCSVRLLTPPAP